MDDKARCVVVLASGEQCEHEAAMTRLCQRHWEMHEKLSPVGVFLDYIDVSIGEFTVRPLR